MVNYALKWRGKRRKILRISRETVDLAVAEYLKNGGKVTKIELPQDAVGVGGKDADAFLMGK